MKAFEKWHMKDAPATWNYGEEDAAEIGWKAALEWVLSKRRLISSRFGPVNLINNNIDCIFIEEELEDNER